MLPTDLKRPAIANVSLLKSQAEFKIAQNLQNFRLLELRTWRKERGNLDPAVNVGAKCKMRRVKRPKPDLARGKSLAMLTS